MAKNDAAGVLHNRIKEDDLCGLFVFTGEEKYSRRAAKTAFLKRFSEDAASEFNIHRFSENKISARDVAEAVESYPVMAERKLIIIENSNLFKSVSEEEKQIWQAIIENIPEYVSIIFDEDELDGRSGLLKKAKEKGLFVEFKYKTPAETVEFCAKSFKKEGIKISAKTLEQLVFQCDEGLESVENEVNKLISYCTDKKEVTEEDVSLLVKKSLQNRIFKMIDEIFDKNATAVFEMLGELKTVNEKPVKIIALIGRQIGVIMKTALLLAEGKSSEVASQIKLPPMIARLYIDKARNKKLEELSEMLNDCLDADYMMKNGTLNDWVSLEILIAKLLKA